MTTNDEKVAIYEQGLYAERQRLQRTITVTRAQIEGIEKEISGILYESTIDPLYFGLVEEILDSLGTTLRKLLELEENLKEDLELCSVGITVYEGGLLCGY